MYSFILVRIRRIYINIVKAKKFVFVGIFFIKMNYYIYMKNLKRCVENRVQ